MPGSSSRSARATPELGRIQETLSSSSTELEWASNAYTLAFASLLLGAGALGDRLGARGVFACGFAMFTLASVACGLSTGAATLVAARIAQGGRGIMRDVVANPA
jgi:DHA2 family methylenomycin A resistance protein-like MFS transporter